METRAAAPHEVVVRMVRTRILDDVERWARARALLSAEELGTLGRLRPRPVRRDYLAGHALARTMIADVIHADPARIRFRPAPGGRPELIAPRRASRVSFSLSHADGIALCAVSAHHAVGADVESLRCVGDDPLGVAATICSTSERALLAASPPATLARRLLSIWTVKEAIAKATGLGVRLPLDRITVHTPSGVCTGAVDAAFEDEPSTWRLASMQPTPRHAAAIAVRSAPDAPVVFRFERSMA